MLFTELLKAWISHIYFIDITHIHGNSLIQSACTILSFGECLQLCKIPPKLKYKYIHLSKKLPVSLCSQYPPHNSGIWQPLLCLFPVDLPTSDISRVSGVCHLAGASKARAPCRVYQWLISLRHIPLSGQTTCLFIHQLMDIWVVSTFCS